ncbi:hypothetical protein G7Z17_g6374 [Cylindrodendrum hubeiense]|uniref:Uncharacterized protein n=1 Tax=Cylindrodendrum hubeiense TaxID=595255 RepID=A0A9P5H7E7_9HYPO|nr:hypothetical protein G7Z17_g6374 [Cylindrodendrum hubeiense]
MAPAPAPSDMLSYMMDRSDKGGAPVPIAGDVMGLLVALASISVLSICLHQRITAIKVWTNLPLVVWLVFVIYSDSMLFVVVTAILQQIFGVNSSYAMCHGAILLCLVCYMTTKFIYVFLVEKAHIIRSTTKTRLQSKLYCFNSFGMLGLYSVVVILNFIFRIAKIDENGVCIIGMRSISMIPLISFDAIVNIYLTILFLIPLKNLYSFKSMPKTAANERLQNVAFRTFVGSCCTLISSIVNLSVLMALNGEPGWVCLMCCNSDILFSALVIQWVTSKDNAGSGGQSSNNTYNHHNENSSRGPRDPHASSHQMNPMAQPPPSPHGTDAEISLVATATAQSSDDGREMDMAKVSSTGGGGGVVVTTTIHRQSRPTSGFGLDLEGNKVEDDDDEVPYGYPPRPPSYGVNNHHEIPEPPRTRITGGKPEARN